MEGIFKMRKFVIGLLITAAILALNWGITIGLVKLITICFGWKFSLLVATGIWLVLFLLSDLFRRE